ncbi:hypothetical protein BC834DRAFT_985913 [Gloeopeniophorella convolvens]|nr:hypothetical protein BC834DRAFT_985913 [Gloeopeniophorella convolvens]
MSSLLRDTGPRTICVLYRFLCSSYLCAITRLGMGELSDTPRASSAGTTPLLLIIGLPSHGARAQCASPRSIISVATHSVLPILSPGNTAQTSTVHPTPAASTVTSNEASPIVQTPSAPTQTSNDPIPELLASPSVTPSPDPTVPWAWSAFGPIVHASSSSQPTTVTVILSSTSTTSDTDPPTSGATAAPNLPPQQSPRDSLHPSRTGPIVGGVVGTFVLLILALLAAYLRRRHLRVRGAPQFALPSSIEHSSTAELVPSPAMVEVAPHDIDPPPYQVTPPPRYYNPSDSRTFPPMPADDATPTFGNLNPNSVEGSCPRAVIAAQDGFEESSRTEDDEMASGHDSLS